MGDSKRFTAVGMVESVVIRFLMCWIVWAGLKF